MLPSDHDRLGFLLKGEGKTSVAVARSITGLELEINRNQNNVLVYLQSSIFLIRKKINP